MPPLSGPSKKEEQKWESEEDIRTLQRADEIKGDPDRLKRAMEMAGEQQESLDRIQATKPLSKIK